MSKIESKQISNENIQIIDNIEETDNEITEEQSSLNQKTQELVDLLINNLNDSSTSVRDLPYAQWAKLIFLISNKVENPNPYHEGKSISTMYKSSSY